MFNRAKVCVHAMYLKPNSSQKTVFGCRETKSGYTLLKRRKMDIQNCSKKNFLESHTHWMQLWNATMENARVKA